MKIVNSSGENLLLTSQKFKMNWSLDYWGGLLYWVFFLWLLFYGTGIETLACQRVSSTRVTCSLKRSIYYDSIEEINEIYTHVFKASLTETKHVDENGGEYTTYETTLLTSSGDIVLRNNDSETAKKINNFIDNPTRGSLTITYDNRLWFSLLAILIFLGNCVALIWTSKETRSYIFDKTLGCFKISQETGTTEYKLSEIVDVKADQYKIYLVLQDRKTVDLGSCHRQQQTKILNAIRNFLRAQ